MSGIITDNLGRSSGLVKAAAGGGKIGQVVTVQNLDQESTSSSSWVEISDLSVSITPTATSSKIWIVSSLTVGWEQAQIMFRLMRDSTAIAVGTGVGNRTAASFSTGREITGLQYTAYPHAFTWLDEPSTVSAVAYTWQWDTATGTTYLNSTDDDSDNKYYCRTPSSITVMEVLA